MSGGNQQEVLIGKWLLSAKKILILDEPTRGVDVKTKGRNLFINKWIGEKRISDYHGFIGAPELINMSDRIVAFSSGYTTGELSRNEFSQERIMTMATER